MRNNNVPELICLSRNIRYLRRRHFLSTKEMAKVLEMHPLTIICIEYGKYPKNIDVKILLNLYVHFGILPSILLGTDLEKRGE